MKTLPIIMLMSASLYAGNVERTTGNSGGTNNDNSSSDEYVVHGDLYRSNHMTVKIKNNKKDTIYIDNNTSKEYTPQELQREHLRNYNPSHSSYNCDIDTITWRIGAEYIFVPVGENAKLINQGLGIQIHALRHTSHKLFTRGFKIGYAQYNNINVKNNIYPETGYPDIDNMITISKALPYKSGSMCIMIGGHHVQGIVGYGFLTNEDVFILGVNYNSNTKISINASFSNLFGINKYSPELGAGISAQIIKIDQ